MPLTEPATLTAREYFLDMIKAVDNAFDTMLIEKALNFCFKAHKNQFRKSGEPFYSHSIETAKILFDLKMDTATICAGLLHDVVEDTGIPLTEIKTEFNETIASLVDGVTKISNIPFKSTEELQVETYRKMLISTAKDIRVLIIKLADRLHNLRTLHYLDAATIKRIAAESLNVYVPLAHRLGMAKMRSEMEDIAFRHLYPSDYEILLSRIVDTKEEREAEIELIRAPLGELTKKAGMQVRIFGRPKHLFSIFKKMKNGKSFDDIYDLFAIRCVTQNILDCYKVLGIIHTNWIPVQYRFKDYIATPKSNMYQSLHTAVIGPKGKMIEVQIRTEDMNSVAEDGIAAHWLYKESAEGETKDASNWLKELSDLPQDLTNHADFMDFFKIDLFQSEIFVFTPKGDLIQLPKGSTVLDFAFAVHTTLGFQCIAGKINGRAYPINTVLRSGVTVEIVKAKLQAPSQHWLNWVKTSKAKRDIRHWLKMKSYEHAAILGKELFDREIKKLGVEDDPSERLMKLFPHFQFTDIEMFYNAIGHGDIPIQVVLDRMFPERGILKSQKQSFINRLVGWKKPAYQSGLIVNVSDNTTIHFGKCCQPLPGDKICGYMIKGKGIEVHRQTCTKGMMLMDKTTQPVLVSWDTAINLIYKIKLQVITTIRSHILSDITRVLADTDTPILNAHVEHDESRIYHTFLVELKNRHQLNNVYRDLRKIRDVRKISRETIFKEGSSDNEQEK